MILAIRHIQADDWMRNANKSPKICNYEMVREVDK